MSADQVKKIRKAAEQGNALAQYNFGACYYNGNGVPKDKTEAVRWFRKAAEQGHEKSKEALRTLGADTLASAGPTSRAQTTPEVPKEEITVGCETVDRLGRRASVLNAFEMPEQAKADASVPMLLALQNLSPVQINLVTSAKGVVFTDAAAAGSVFDDYGKTVASVILKEGSAFKRGSITITVYRTTGLEAGVVMLKWDEHETVFNYYVRPGFNQQDPFVRTANAEEAFSRLVWKRPANPTKQP